jgi:plastocyanin domain-containing protein
MRTRPTWLAACVLAASLIGCARHHASSGALTRVAITVTENGFEPALVSVPAGRPVTLLVTRRTDETCARDFVMPDQHIRRPLPLDRTVEITFTPAKPGDLRYACAMDMYSGIVRVE